MITREFHRTDIWEGFKISGHAAMIDGSPGVVAVWVVPVSTAGPVRISSTSLRGLPLERIAAETFADLQVKPVNSKKLTEVEAVAAHWNAAYEAGQAPREYVVKKLGLSVRTADRRIARARQLNLIVAPLRGGWAPRSKTGATA